MGSSPSDDGENGGALTAGPRPEGGFQVIAAGEALLAPRITRRLIAAFTRHTPPAAGVRSGLEVLTDRERQVLALIAHGLSNTEIGQHLHVTLGTVKTHVGRLLSKLAARDRAQLVIAAYEAGLVTPAPR
jgi:DNA-binding NarL/FixJ family response regulator